MGNARKEKYNSNPELTEKPSSHTCEWCHHMLSRKPVVHRNPSLAGVIVFCSRDCHNAWCYAHGK